MQIRAAFSGASATGKSTLARFVAEAYGLPINPIGARSVATAMGFESPYDVDKAGRRAEFQRRVVTEKMQWEAEHNGFVTDRTTLDNLTYMALHDVHSVTAEFWTTAELGMRQYTHVFFCPMSGVFNPGDDNARVKDRTYHELYELMLRELQQRAVDRGTRLIHVWEKDSNARRDRVKRALDGMRG